MTMAHKYSAEMEKYLEKHTSAPINDDQANIDKFLNLTEREIQILEVEMSLDGWTERDWEDVWGYWFFRKDE